MAKARFRSLKTGVAFVALLTFGWGVYEVLENGTLMGAPAYAENISDTETTDVEVIIDSTLSLTVTPGSLELAHTSGDPLYFYSGAVTAKVSTNSNYGYKLQYSAATKTTAFTSTTDASKTIPTISSSTTLADLKSSNQAGKWGFTHDNTALLAAGTYLPTPAANTPTTIKNTATAASDDATVATFGANIEGVAAGEYTENVMFSAFTNYAAGKTLQNFTNSICANDYDAFDAANASGTTYALVDNRDGRQYNVRKLADGKCWIVQNLAYAPGGKLSVDYSDVDAASIYEIPTTAWASSVNDPYATTIDGTVYYNWRAATASQNGDGQDIQSLSTSVCPKGWKLPTSTIFSALVSAYNSNNATFDTAFNNTYSGYVSDGAVYSAGERGDYWAVNMINGTNAYQLKTTSSSFDVGGISRNGGRVVRCYFAGS